MKLKPLPLLIAALFSLVSTGLSNETSPSAKPPATDPDKFAMSESLKQTQARLLGKWTVSAEATKAIPVDTVKHPWVPGELAKVLKVGLGWEFRADGTVIMTYESRSATEEYRLFQDQAGEVWIAFSKGDNWSLQRTRFEGGHLHLTVVARDRNEQEVPILGTLVFIKSQ